ncbi:MAG: hypothetical protein IJC89_01820 [Clostridia bacterium]|nr:hypothetical protein [Clostridia bacterium]
MKYLLGADIGTTSLKAAVFDEKGNQIRVTTKDYTLIVSGDKVEFPAEDYFKLFKEAYDEISQGLEISALAVDTQCETMILTDENGTPLSNAIVWLDNRAAKQAEDIKAKFGNEKVYEITGQPEITATWPAAKLLWVKENQPEIFAKTKKIFLLEDYILYKLTGEFVTEQTLQSSSLYFDIHKFDWWQEMLDYIGITREMLPRVEKSAVKVGTYEGATVVTGAIDQIAGAIGAGVMGEGIISEMTGTTMAIFAPCETIPEYNPESIIPCHINFDGKYCLLSWTPTAGIALKWFKNNFCENFSFKELDQMAEKVSPGCNGLTFLPFLCGSTMPKYNPDARGAFLGLTMEHTRAHMIRSVLEAVACLLKENLDYLGVSCSEIRSMGGGATSPLWCKIKADMTGKKIVTLENNETACLGSAFLAGMGAGIYSDISECAKMVAVKKVYEPANDDYTECFNNFKKAEEMIV